MAISAIVIAYQNEQGIFVANTHVGLRPLAEIITKVVESRGVWQSIGMCRDDAPGVQGIMCAIYVIVPDESQARGYFVPEEK